VSGGVRRYVSEKIKHLNRAGDQHLLIIPGAGDAVRGDSQARTYTIASPQISRVTQYRALIRLDGIERILAAERPDIVECGDPYQVGWRTAKACQRLQIPAVAFYHSHFAESELRPLQRWIGKNAADLLVQFAAKYCSNLYNRFSRTFVPSPLLCEALKSWGVENTVSVDMGADMQRFEPASIAKKTLRRSLNLPENQRLLLSVGRLSEEKNTATLCKAFDLLASQHTYHLVIIGEGMQRRLVERLAEKTGSVTWLPFLSDHKQLLAYYQAADLFVHPGLKETFGLVTIEAQACGLPIVGFTDTAMNRIICHEQDFWATERTPSALAASIHAAFERDLSTLGSKARREVVVRFDWATVFARQFDLYHKVIHKQST
jgi:alpha-1,6-mannosyltransferase